MGNLHSSLSNRKTSQSTSPTSTESTDVQDAVVNQRLDMPDGDREETAGLGQQPATGKRKSLLNFSSLRKRQKTTEKSDNQLVDSPDSVSYRPWRSGLGGSRVRPTSVLLPPSATIPARRPSSAIIPSPAPSSIKRKGKERDEGANTANGISLSNGPTRIDDAPPVLTSELPVAEEEMPLSEQVLLELRNLQTDASTKSTDTTATEAEGSGNTISNIKEEEEVANDWRNTRPYTPQLTRPEESSSLTQLSDTLGSWMGGVGRANETNSLPNEAEAVLPPTIDSTSPPHITSPPTSTSATNPVPEVSPSLTQNNPTGRRPLPPTGTGTIVVVQGVVHTADVRQSHQLSHQSPVSHRPPRPVSSTPTLRNVSHGLSTGSPSATRSTTPQPNPRRNRFSSFTDTLRQRSSSRTPTSSRTRNRNVLVEDVSDDSSRSQSVLSLDNPSSDSETSASLTEASSSVGAVVSTDDTSTEELLYRPRYDRPMDSSYEPEARGRNSFADDDNDAELSPGSIEVLGTLLSVATAATAASLVSGTTEPLFQSGLTGSSGNRSTDDSLSGLPRSVNARPNNGTDRMRSAWDNLRDRFSRSRRRNFEDDSPSEGEDTREQMVREMARAFNLNLGRNSPEREEERPGSPDSTQPTSNTDAPEGSFERFLHNLQVDLRTALAEDYAARRSRGRAGRRGSDTTDPEHQDLGHPPASAENQSESHTASTENPAESASDVYQPRSPRSVSIDLPILPAAAESPSTTGSEARPQATGVTGQPGAGINWWRLYRFPPMVMASSPSAMANDNTSSSNPSTVSTGIASQTTQPQQPQSNRVDIARTGDILSRPMESTDHQGQTPQSPQQPQSTQQQEQQPASSDGPQQVVPVIVVGLQSVPVNRNVPSDGNHFTEAEHAAEFPSEPTRGRSWPLRAASSASRAFSRMGRRNEDSSAENPNNDNTEARERHAGRTYLIFVIGGYYPPNHGIVTGADDMNSFEALWELAELIGQVKPQVASKEDIEHSGLEVLKASQLSEYEDTNKVASNTIERCLICLDDYEPDDDVRLLKCRHAFHRSCVDKWLEQGRNNCPACRSKGVTTNDEQRTTTTAS